MNRHRFAGRVLRVLGIFLIIMGIYGAIGFATKVFEEGSVYAVDVPCYDGHRNEIQGLICEEERITYGVELFLFMFGFLFGFITYGMGQSFIKMDKEMQQ